MSITSFAHSGDLGDVVYALPTIKALGGGEVCFYRDPRCREQFDLKRAHNIGVFLAEQSYVRRWRLVEDATDVKGFDYDFGKWRDTYDGHSNLAYSQARAFGVDPKVADEPWLTVEYPARVERVVVIRSHRYREHGFPWRALAQKYRDEAVVLGTQGEFEELQHQFGFRYRLETATLTEMARVIAGADVVITNQTCGYAIAEGLKKKVILERFAPCPNVDFNRHGVWTGERVKEWL